MVKKGSDLVEEMRKAEERRLKWFRFMEEHDPPTEKQWREMQSHQHYVDLPRSAGYERIRTDGAKVYEPAECPFP